MAEKLITELRDLPAVEEILQEPRLAASIGRLPRPYATLIVREELELIRRRLRDDGKPVSRTTLLKMLEDRLDAEARVRLTRVVNATGVLVHTNLGRAPLSELQFEKLKEVAIGYSNLEFDLEAGERGARGVACEKYIALLAEAESAAVVNNCAAALFVILNTFANRKSVLISRGELVQIGGGFRVPDILRRSGAKLVEVGTSNITTLSDYELAVDQSIGLILKVHKSNFSVTGFTEEATLKQLVELGKKRGVPVVHDLGSGLAVPTSEVLGHQETTIQQSTRDGATLTCCSADKLFGSSQAGLIVGNAEQINQIKKNPLFRTIRVDKLVFALLEMSAAAFLDNRWSHDVPLWRLATTSVETLQSRAHAILRDCGNPACVTVCSSQAYVGGGSLPDAPIPSIAIRFDASRNPRKLIKMFRGQNPPIIGRVADDAFFLDLKSVDETEDVFITVAMKSVLG